MTWLHSVATGLITAIFGAIAMVFLADRWSEWYRVGSYSGKNDIYVSLIAFLGFAAAFLIGLSCSRYVVTEDDAHFTRGLGLAFVCLAGLMIRLTASSYLLADKTPKVDGRTLDLDVEIRTPPVTPLLEQTGLTPEVSIQKNPHSVSSSLLLSREAAQRTNGTYLLVFKIPLESSSSTRIFNVYWFGDLGLFYRLSLPAQPSRDDFEWTDWLTPSEVVRHGDWDADGVDTTFPLLYRVVFREDQTLR